MDKRTVRYAIFAEGHFDNHWTKTGNAILRYRPEEAVCVIDSVTAGKTAREVLEWGPGIPVVASLQEALSYGPTALLVGLAPAGGQVAPEWVKTFQRAIHHGLDIVSGMHTFLADLPELADHAREHGVSLVDLRRPPQPLPFSQGTWRNRTTPVLLTVGTDCDTGKMTTAWELTQAVNAAGRRAVFVGTGQTGILLGGHGVAVDAVVSDFVAGAIEAEIDRSLGEADLILVEGQGSLTHMAYSGVTLGLLHGTMPDMLILCDEVGRKEDILGHPIPSLSTVIDLHHRLMAPFKPCAIVGISLITRGMSERAARERIETTERELGIPATDPVRFGVDPIARGVLERLADQDRQRAPSIAKREKFAR